jgi:hypothetical protein
MTIFGKCVFGGIFILAGVSLFYGVRSYVHHNEVIEVIKVVEMSSSSPTTSLTEAVEKDALSLDSFLKKDGSYVCTFTPKKDTKQLGTMYIHNGVYAVILEATSTEASLKEVFILDNNYRYAWDSVSKKILENRYKVASTTNITKLASTTQEFLKKFDLEGITEYSCNDWVYDKNVFVVPQGVMSVTQ